MTDQARKSSQIYFRLDKYWRYMWEETHSEPSLAIFGLDCIEIAEPVAVPSPKCSGIMDPDGVNTIDVHG